MRTICCLGCLLPAGGLDPAGGPAAAGDGAEPGRGRRAGAAGGAAGQVTRTRHCYQPLQCAVQEAGDQAYEEQGGGAGVQEQEEGVYQVS